MWTGLITLRVVASLNVVKWRHKYTFSFGQTEIAQ